MSFPDFLIVGAMKCGTSTLQAQLAAQPGIFMSTPKEPNFFSDDPIYAKGLDWYESLFEAAAPGDLKGEASTHYTKLPTHPDALPRLREVLKAPRLIYMIRNPLDRLVSHYVHEWSQGVISTDLATALDRHPELVDYGRYAYQIAPWVEAFGAENVLILTLGQMKGDPQGTLDTVGAFLGYEQPMTWQAQQARMNASAERVRRLPMQGLLVDNPVATALRRALVPKAIRTRIRDARKMTSSPEIPPERRRALEAVFAEDFARLSALFPGRADLATAYPFVTA